MGGYFWDEHSRGATHGAEGGRGRRRRRRRKRRRRKRIGGGRKEVWNVLEGLLPVDWRESKKEEGRGG